MKIRFLMLLALLIITFSCADKAKDEAKVEAALLALFQKEKALNCQLASMKDSITTEWDNINQLLKEKLPADMPQEEKINMLKVRNASLIRMFQSFDNVDSNVKMALKETEKLDMEMSRRITALKQEVQKIESEKMVLFKEINQTNGAHELERYKEIYQSVLSENCK